MKYSNKRKGQVMVLDVTFTIVLVILIFFLLFRWVEMKTYESISDRKQIELSYVAENIFFSLTNNYNINCYAGDNNNQFLITSCFSSNSPITIENIGLPANYNCSFIIDGFNLSNNSGCSSVFTDSNNYSMIKFKVITTINNSMAVQKSTYLDNILNRSSNLVQRDATLVIWK